MLHINNKDYSEERANQKPLSLNEQYEVLNDLRCIIEEHTYFRSREGIKPAVTKRIQKLLYHYENLQAFYNIQGGWDGVNRLRDKANAYNELMKQNKDKENKLKLPYAHSDDIQDLV